MKTSNTQQPKLGLPSTPNIQQSFQARAACVKTTFMYRGTLQKERPEGLLWAEREVNAKHFSEIRRRVMLDGFKWDSQVGDLTALANFPLVMRRSLWIKLATLAENLTAEAMAAEQEIARRPELLRLLGLPPALLEVFLSNEPLTPAAGRVIRFDFHLTTDGWRISEANSDVPGGFSEGSHFTELLARQYPQLGTAGSPGQAWCDVLAASAGAGGQVALLSAAPVLEDHQVNSFIASQLRERGCVTHLAKPEQICWRDGVAHLEASWHRGPVDAMVRFYQAEWLPKLRAESGWRHFFRGGRTPVANPALGVISESKRFPLTWEYLKTDLPTWKMLLPECCDPRGMSWFNGHDWLLKTAYCNNGESVCMSQLMSSRRWWQMKLMARLQPGNWVAQRRFESAPVPTPHGPRHVCVGIYTVNGKAVGAYARISEKPLMDYTAVDVALLIDDNE